MIGILGRARLPQGLRLRLMGPACLTLFSMRVRRRRSPQHRQQQQREWEQAAGERRASAFLTCEAGLCSWCLLAVSARSGVLLGWWYEVGME